MEKKTFIKNVFIDIEERANKHIPFSEPLLFNSGNKWGIIKLELHCGDSIPGSDSLYSIMLSVCHDIMQVFKPFVLYFYGTHIRAVFLPRSDEVDHLGKMCGFSSCRLCFYTSGSMKNTYFHGSTMFLSSEEKVIEYLHTEQLKCIIAHVASLLPRETDRDTYQKILQLYEKGYTWNTDVSKNKLGSFMEISVDTGQISRVTINLYIYIDSLKTVKALKTLSE